LESLILGIEDLKPKTSRAVLELLARLADAPEGVLPPAQELSVAVETGSSTILRVDAEHRALLRGLLHIGLYREVMIFLQQRKDLNAVRDTAEALRHILTRVVSITSRKGGVGKSMLTLATAAWFLKAVRPGANVCILDL